MSSFDVESLRPRTRSPMGWNASNTPTTSSSTGHFERQRLQNLSNQMQLENAELKATLDLERSKQIKSMRDLAKRVQQTEIELDESRGRVSALREEVERARAERTSAEREGCQLRMQMESEASQYHNIGIRLKKAMFEAEERSAELSQHIQAAATLREQLSESCQRREQQRLQIIALSQRCSQAEQRADKIDHQNEMLQEQLKSTEQQYQKRVMELEVDSADVRRRSSMISKEVSELAEAKSAVQRRLTQTEHDLGDKITQQHDLISDLKRRLGLTMQQVTELSQKLKESQTKTEDIQNNFETEKRFWQHKEHQLRQLQEQNKQQQSMWLSRQQQDQHSLASLKAELTNHQDKLHEAFKQRDSLENRLQAHIKDQQQQSESAQHQLTRKTSEVNELRSVNASLLERMGELKAELKASVAHVDSLTKQERTLSEKLNSSQLKIEHIQFQHQKEIHALQLDLSNTSTKVSETNKLLQDEKQQNQKQRIEASDLSDKYINLQELVYDVLSTKTDVTAKKSKRKSRKSIRPSFSGTKGARASQVPRRKPTFADKLDKDIASLQRRITLSEVHKNGSIDLDSEDMEKRSGMLNELASKVSLARTLRNNRESVGSPEAGVPKGDEARTEAIRSTAKSRSVRMMRALDDLRNTFTDQAF